MATLVEFLDRLMGEGRVVFRGAPGREAAGDERIEAAARLRRAFEREAMELAGPPLAFEEQAALRAAEWTRKACWFLVSRGEPPEVVDRSLPIIMPKPPGSGPGSTGEHLAADLTFRYLPAVHRRARAIDPGDLLCRRLAELLRAWPLSGAAADLEDGPTTPIALYDHAGLLLLFAERLAAHPKPSWIPRQGPARDWWAVALDAAGGDRP